jgi:hypothetical protein
VPTYVVFVFLNYFQFNNKQNIDQQYVFDRLPLNDVQKQALLEELIKARSDRVDV